MFEENFNKICPAYLGLACIDGSCPIANRDEYAERGYYIVSDCSQCNFYKGCEDCYFAGTKDCLKFEKGGVDND